MAGRDVDVVRRLWALFQARDWAGAEALLAPQARCIWWATNEQFDGAPAIVHVNAVYPEGWTIHLIEVNSLADGRVHSLVRVTMADGPTVYANSFFILQGGLITDVQEYWSTVELPPAWREAGLQGQTRLPADGRGAVPIN